MSDVELGFLEECETWFLESRFFPSKVGGKPAWLALEHLPSTQDLQCPKCKEIMIFLCQVYAPLKTGSQEKTDQNFHRTLFVFLCRKANCYEVNQSDTIKVFRSSLARKNKFYSFEPPEEKPDPEFTPSKWTKLCQLCGCAGDKQCGRCKTVTYCSKEHQIRDWKDGHKKTCQKPESAVYKSSALFPEWELITETEIIEDKKIDEKAELKKLEEFQRQGKSGTLNDVSEKELDEHAPKEKDRIFQKFKKTIASYPDQVIRYSKNGTPLLIAREPVPENVPNCEYCGSSRQFEFQIMPQMLTFLKETDLDWGVLLVYTCKNSCTDSDNRYKKEFVFKQDVSDEKPT